ncbi:glycosyltransferase family 39 protein [Candidatus Sumerlaeota bacterium]|nr:glycosyltransferase family 39 protein [Candidatus Sumerlaeota bacterium]
MATLDDKSQRMSRFALTLLLLLLLAAAHAAWHVQHDLRMLAFPFPQDYVEGVTQLMQQRFNEGLTLYPIVSDQPPWLHNPYPPMGYWITHIVGRLTGTAHPYRAARLAALLATLICAGLIFRLSACGRGRFCGFAAVGLFLFSPLVLRYGCFCRPDMLALMFSLAAVAALWNRRNAGLAALAGVCAALALLTKPQYFAAGLAISVHLFRNDRKLLAPFLATLCGSCGLALAMLHIQSDGAVWSHLFALNVLPFDWGGGMARLADFAGRHALLLTALILLLINPQKSSADEPPRDLAWMYGLCALLPLPLIAKTGAEENYLLELLAVGSLAAGRFASRLDGRTLTIGAALLAAQWLVYLPVQPQPVFSRTYGQELSSDFGAITPTQMDRDIGGKIVEEFRMAEGDVLACDVGYVMLSGKPVIYQPFQFTQLARSGRFDAELLIERIESGSFALIMLRGPAGTPEESDKDGAGLAPGDLPEASTAEEIQQSPFFTNAMLRVINRHYALKRQIGPYFLYEPKI